MSIERFDYMDVCQKSLEQTGWEVKAETDEYL